MPDLKWRRDGDFIARALVTEIENAGNWHSAMSAARALVKIRRVQADHEAESRHLFGSDSGLAEVSDSGSRSG